LGGGLYDASGNDITEVGLASDIDGFPGTQQSGNAYLPTLISEIDPDQVLWNRDEGTGSSPFGNDAGQTGYFRVYGDGESESAGVAIPSERQGEFNESRIFMYKTRDTIPLGGITYNILYEIIVSGQNLGNSYVGHFIAEIGKVFLCRAPNGE
jgi:hypothetical protein